MRKAHVPGNEPHENRGPLHPGALQANLTTGQRLASLDFFRGLIMMLLMLESSGIYEHFVSGTEGSFLHGIAIQFTHHPWHGLHFWDLIQPGFMFIAGTAMAFSIARQDSRGRTRRQESLHALKRSGWLFFWGVLDYAVRGDHLSFELWDVLTQLSFTMLVAFFIYRWKTGYQLLLSGMLLVLTEVLYRYSHFPGFDQPFTDQHNFGNYVDWLLMHKVNPGGWVAINCIPTAAHTIWGAVAGKWLLSGSGQKRALRNIVLLAAAVLALGYALDGWGVTPIIKRIATTSFTLVSGGYCLAALAFFVAWIDVRQHHRGLFPFVVVSRNSIFIYLFFEIVVSRWLADYFNVIVRGILAPTGLPVAVILVAASVAIFLFEWGLCYWLYRKKIFFRL